MKAFILPCLIIGLLSACSNEQNTPSAKSNAPTSKALPFRIEGAMLSDAFQNNLKVAKIEVGVDGGEASEWSATSIAIAEKVATFGVDSVEVSVRRNEITETQGVRFREVIHTYFSPNPKRTVWDGTKNWQVLQADSAHLATQQDVAIIDEFDSLNQKFVASGMDIDAADKKAGALIAKKFHLPPEWQLPLGNSLHEIPRESISVDTSLASDGLAKLTQCLNGKIIRVMTTCGND